MYEDLQPCYFERSKIELRSRLFIEIIFGCGRSAVKVLRPAAYIKSDVLLNPATLCITGMSLWLTRMMGFRKPILPSHLLHQPRPIDASLTIDLMGGKIPGQDVRILGGPGRSCFDVRLARKSFLQHKSDYCNTVPHPQQDPVANCTSLHSLRVGATGYLGLEPLRYRANRLML